MNKLLTTDYCSVNRSCVPASMRRDLVTIESVRPVGFYCRSGLDQMSDQTEPTQRVSRSNAIGHTPVAGPYLQSRIDRLAFQCQNPEDTLMGASQRFFADKPFKCFDAEGELAPSQ
jgi:hypothetical protein